MVRWFEKVRTAVGALEGVERVSEVELASKEDGSLWLRVGWRERGASRGRTYKLSVGPSGVEEELPTVQGQRDRIAEVVLPLLKGLLFEPVASFNPLSQDEDFFIPARGE